MSEELFQQVMQFVAKERGVSPESLTPDTTLFWDLGTDGDDGVELLERFAERFGVDMTGCNPRDYFGPEGCNPLLIPYGLVLWISYLFPGDPYKKAGVVPIKIGDLVRAAEAKRWQATGLTRR